MNERPLSNHPRRSGLERRGPRRSALLVGLALVASAGIGLQPLSSGVAVAGTKKTPSKPVFTAKQVAGSYRWVKSTVSIKFSDGKTGGGTVSYGPNDFITFVAKPVAGSKVAGTFTMSTAQYGSAKGKWYLYQNGTVIAWVIEPADGSDYLYSYRRIDQLDKKRMTLSADDALIVDTYEENGLAEIGDRKVVGGSAYDELVRK
jgi:hypothetical protein